MEWYHFASVVLIAALYVVSLFYMYYKEAQYNIRKSLYNTIKKKYDERSTRDFFAKLREPSTTEEEREDALYDMRLMRNQLRVTPDPKKPWWLK